VRSVSALALPLLLASCGGREPPYRWRDGAAAVLEVRVREELLPTPLAREVQVAFEGRVEGASAVVFDVVRVRHERVGAGGALTVVETHDVGASPVDRTAEDAAVSRVAESMVRRSVRLSFDPRDGLVAVSGMDAALEAAPAAGDAAAEEVRDGLRSLLSDAALLRGLRAAGLTAPPEDFRDRAAVVERRIDVYVPGRGVSALRMLGDVGEEKDGSPVVRCSGRFREDASFTGPAGQEPPPEVGSVRVAKADADAETLFDLATAQPLRGRCTIRLPFTSGATVATRTSFTLSVRP
jgi:hypothetical protein